jgi:hypothetical protein
MSKTIRSGLTRSRKQRDRAKIVHCLDAINDQWNTLRAITGLLALTQECTARVVDAEVIGEAAEMMEAKLDELKASLARLEKEIES